MPDDASASPVPPPVPGMPLPPPVPAAIAPPPVPRPVPPPVPPSLVPGGGNAAAADGIGVSSARVIRRDRPDRTAAALGASALVIAAVTLALYVAWPQLQNVAWPRLQRVAWQQREDVRKAARRPDPEATQRPDPAATTRSRPIEPHEPLPESKPAPGLQSQPAAKPESRPAPTPRSDPKQGSKPEPSPPPKPSPGLASPPPAEPEPPAVDVEKVRAVVGTAVSKACDALRQRDFAAAKRELAAVAEQALDDQQATDRLQRWQVLAMYAEAYPVYRDKALDSAAATAGTYDTGKRQIGVVEVTAKEFIYRDSRRPGRNQRAPRDAIPPDVEAVLVEQWFAKDGRAANHLFLGAAAVTRREPDLGTARRAWQAAAAGGEEHGRLLLGILDDPVLRGR